MNILHNPEWLNQFKYSYESVDQIPQNVIADINRDLDRLQGKDPLVSILISAWNEEINILRSIASLSRQKTSIPFEIIVINNNSADRTQETIDKLHVRSLFQEIQGCGPSRQLGQENARGKYILLADADCLYPEHWMDEMIRVLSEPKTVCVYGRYSFISEPGFPRWKLSFLEKMKDVIAEVRHLKRPYLNAYGLSMGYVKEYGLKVGFVMTKFWGDDGKMCLGLMKYGKVKQVRSEKARVWTGPRTLQRDGSFFSALTKRVKKDLKRFFKNFNSKLPE